GGWPRAESAFARRTSRWCPPSAILTRLDFDGSASYPRLFATERADLRVSRAPPHASSPSAGRFSGAPDRERVARRLGGRRLLPEGRRSVGGARGPGFPSR